MSKSNNNNVAAKIRFTLMLGSMVLTSSFSVMATGTDVEFGMAKSVAETKVVTKDDIETEATTCLDGTSCQIVCPTFPRCW
jgi:hypothetical protein